ncbi:MAG: aminoacyl-tRNA hydrolase [Clostridiales bacterium]|jgi:PTH1 family peptidyl-tRNA hydrolase|nr:aminoacyl-tRNA hydrolase [Clostridiales bacterium]
MTAIMGAWAGAAGGGAPYGGAPYLIVGLGNPGREYEATRHNAGFFAIDMIAERTGIGVHRKKFKSLVGEGRHGGAKLVLIKPQTYMNLSGEAVAEAVRYYGAAPERLILVYDDADIPFATIRVRPYGSPGTHNGMRSVAECLGGWKFPRVRVGIGAPPARMDIRDYVLARMAPGESERLAEAAALAAAAAVDIALLGIDKAMNLHNPAKSAPRNSKRAAAGGEGATGAIGAQGAEAGAAGTTGATADAVGAKAGVAGATADVAGAAAGATGATAGAAGATDNAITGTEIGAAVTGSVAEGCIGATGAAADVAGAAAGAACAGAEESAPGGAERGSGGY